MVYLSLIFSKVGASKIRGVKVVAVLMYHFLALAPALWSENRQPVQM